LSQGVNVTPLEGSHNRKRLSSLIRDVEGGEEGGRGGGESNEGRFVSGEDRHNKVENDEFGHKQCFKCVLKSDF